MTFRRLLFLACLDIQPSDRIGGPIPCPMSHVPGRKAAPEAWDLYRTNKDLGDFLSRRVLLAPAVHILLWAEHGPNNGHNHEDPTPSRDPVNTLHDFSGHPGLAGSIWTSRPTLLRVVVVRRPSLRRQTGTQSLCYMYVYSMGSASAVVRIMQSFSHSLFLSVFMPSLVVGLAYSPPRYLSY